MTPAVKKSVAGALLLFLILFPHYSVYVAHPGRVDSLLEWFFSLTHFVASQTLGIVHEAGHGICYLLRCPQGVTVFNGTLFQWAFPAGIAWYYWKRGERFGAMVSLFFLGFSMQYTAWYISTATQGPIIPAARSFLGVDAYHDFHWLLSGFPGLEYAGLIGGVVRFFAYLVMLGAMVGMVLEAFAVKR
jgi:hypothetical protein